MECFRRATLAPWQLDAYVHCTHECSLGGRSHLVHLHVDLAEFGVVSKLPSLLQHVPQLADDVTKVEENASYFRGYSPLVVGISLSIMLGAKVSADRRRPRGGWLRGEAFAVTLFDSRGGLFFVFFLFFFFIFHFFFNKKNVKRHTKRIRASNNEKEKREREGEESNMLGNTLW